MKVKIERFEEAGEDMVKIVVNESFTQYYNLCTFQDSNAMYSHILGYTLSELFDKWSYEVQGEYLCDDDCDKIYTCRVYYDAELVIESSYNEYNGFGDGVGIVQTIDAFAEFDIDVEIEQESCSGGWCYDEIV